MVAGRSFLAYRNCTQRVIKPREKEKPLRPAKKKKKDIVTYACTTVLMLSTCIQTLSYKAYTLLKNVFINEQFLFDPDLLGLTAKRLSAAALSSIAFFLF